MKQAEGSAQGDPGRAGRAEGGEAERAEAERAERPLAIAVLGDANSIHVRRWVSYFAGHGHKMTLLVPEGVAVEPGYEDGIAIERYAPQAGWRFSQIGLIASGLSLRRAVNRIRPDILQVHYLTLNGFRAWMSGFHPRVVTVWGNDVLIDPRRSARARLLARLALRSADLVTGGSQHLVKEAVAAGARPERTRYVHLGVDTDHFRPGDCPPEFRSGLGVPGARVVLSPRAIAPLYRQDVVVEAFARLPAVTLLVLTLQGAQKSELAALRARADALGVADRIRILPRLAESELPDLYRLSDVVVSVPTSDGGPKTVVEALACGRPVVASDLPPNREWLADLDPGCLVPVGDAAATAAAIGTVLARSPQQRAELADRGRAAVLERADQRLAMAEMEALYRRLAAPPSAR